MQHIIMVSFYFGASNLCQVRLEFILELSRNRQAEQLVNAISKMV